MTEVKNDSGIVKLFFLRDDSALKVVSEVYGSKMHRLAMKFLGSKEDAEECVNDALMRAWESIPPNNPTNLSAYMMTLCRNEALNKIDWKNRKKRRGELVSLSTELENCISGNEITEKDYDLNELISTFLHGISKEKRIMFMRRYWYGDSIEDIAVKFGCSKGNVKVTLHRIRNELKEYLKKEGVIV